MKNVIKQIETVKINEIEELIQKKKLNIYEYFEVSALYDINIKNLFQTAIEHGDKIKLDIKSKKNCKIL